MTAWEELRETCLKCQACQLRQTCTQVVFGVGDPNAEVLFIGEAPGANAEHHLRAGAAQAAGLTLQTSFSQFLPCGHFSFSSIQLQIS